MVVLDKVQAEAIFRIDSIINLHANEIEPEVFTKLNETVEDVIIHIFESEEEVCLNKSEFNSRTSFGKGCSQLPSTNPYFQTIQHLLLKHIEYFQLFHQVNTEQ